MPRRGVFKIINKKTGKVYIGSSNTNLDNLIYSYWQKLYSGEHHNTQLQSDFNRYGRSNFQVVIVNGSCRSENEVRSIREYEIYVNRHNTYNKDVPVHYGGGNPNGGFGGYYPNRNQIINDLLDIVDKSNLYPSYKSKIKSDIRNGKITNETQLNNEIRYYTQLRKLLDILDQSDLSYSEKSSIRIDIKNGKIRNETQLNNQINFFKERKIQRKRLLKILENTNLKESEKEKIRSDITSAKITTESQLYDKINFYKKIRELLKILENSDLKESEKEGIRPEIKNGKIRNKTQLFNKINNCKHIRELIKKLERYDLKKNDKKQIKAKIRNRKITNETQLNEEIKIFKILYKYDKHTIKKLSNQYCSYSTYSTWTQKREKIVFENSITKPKIIPVDLLQKEIETLKHEILYSQIPNSKLKFKVFELAEIFTDVLNFNSYDLNSANDIIFDNIYKLDIKSFEELYIKLNLTKENKSRLKESTINNRLNRVITTKNFNKTTEDIITEYCKINYIIFWDLINRNTVLLYEDHLTLISIEDIVEKLDPLYKEFNIKLRPLDLRNIYHVIKRVKNIPTDTKTDPIKNLLNILSKSDLTITTKIRLKNDINKGIIYSEDSLNKKIKSLMKKERNATRRKNIRITENGDSEENDNTKKSKKERNNTRLAKNPNLRKKQLKLAKKYNKNNYKYYNENNEQKNSAKKDKKNSDKKSKKIDKNTTITQIICPYCKKKIDSSENFCIFCGKKIRKSSVTNIKPKDFYVEPNEKLLRYLDGCNIDNALRNSLKNEVRQGKIRNIQNLKKKINEGKNSSRKNTEIDVINPNLRKKQLELTKKDNKKNYKYSNENNKQKNSVNDKIKFKNGLKICPKCNHAQNKINKVCPKCYHMFE